MARLLARVNIENHENAASIQHRRITQAFWRVLDLRRGRLNNALSKQRNFSCKTKTMNNCGPRTQVISSAALRCTQQR